MKNVSFRVVQAITYCIPEENLLNISNMTYRIEMLFLQLYSYAAIQLCSYTAMQLYSYAVIQLCSYTAMQLYRYAAIQLCSYTAMQLYSYAHPHPLFYE